MSHLLNKKILIIDDERELLQLIEKVLRKEGFTRVYTAETGEEGIKCFLKECPELVVLDIMLPDMEGYEVCKRIRHESTVPILFLSAKTEELDRILGFAIGADDYISKPFSPKELAYRIKAHLRRNQMVLEPAVDPTLVRGPFKIDTREMTVYKNGIPLQMKAKEYKLFTHLASHPNQIMSKERLCEAVWGEDFLGFDNTIAVHMRRIREKIEDDPSAPKYLITVKGLGYKFEMKD